MKLKKVAAVVLTGLLGLNLVSCGTAEAKEVSNQKVTVGIWNGNETEQKAFEEVINNFTEQTGIKVEKKIYTDYSTQLRTDLIGGTAPDVFYLDLNLSSELINAKVVEPLSSYFTDEFDIDDVYDSLLTPFTDESGEIYSIPKDYSSLAVYYNEALLEEAGVGVDDIPKNLEEWPQFLKELQSKLPEGKSALIMDPALDRLLGFIETTGIDVVNEEGYSNLTNPKIVEVLKLITTLYESKNVRRASDLGFGWNGDAFGCEAAAIMIEGTWVVGHLENNFPDVKFGVGEMPKLNKKESTLLFTTGYSMNSASENKENAWKFIEYATGKEGMETWTTGSGVLPARKSITDKTGILDNKAFRASALGAEYGTTFQKGLTLPIIHREFDNWIPAVILGSVTVEEAVEKITKTANKDITVQIK